MFAICLPMSLIYFEYVCALINLALTKLCRRPPKKTSIKVTSRLARIGHLADLLFTKAATSVVNTKKTKNESYLTYKIMEA